MTRLHLFFADERALHALRLVRAVHLDEHVAAAEQVLGALLVEDRARVDLLRDAEGDARREVRLDHAGDDVDARTLRREDHVHAGGARLLREARDADLDVLALLHHQVGELVDDDDDERELLGQRLLALGIVAAHRQDLLEAVVVACRRSPCRAGS